MFTDEDPPPDYYSVVSSVPVGGKYPATSPSAPEVYGCNGENIPGAYGHQHVPECASNIPGASYAIHDQNIHAPEGVAPYSPSPLPDQPGLPSYPPASHAPCPTCQGTPHMSATGTPPGQRAPSAIYCQTHYVPPPQPVVHGPHGYTSMAVSYTPGQPLTYTGLSGTLNTGQYTHYPTQCYGTHTPGAGHQRQHVGSPQHQGQTMQATNIESGPILNNVLVSFVL